MERLMLTRQDDVGRVIDFVQSGVAVWVGVGDDEGPEGPEPRVEILRILLDQTQRRYAVTDLEWSPHPFIPKNYLRSCVIRPEPPGRAHAEVREPRNPSPNLLTASVALDRPL